jgi:hypothetical protein
MLLANDSETGVYQERAEPHGEKHIVPTTLDVRGACPRERRSNESCLLDGLSSPEGSADLPPILSAQLLKGSAPFFEHSALVLALD